MTANEAHYPGKMAPNRERQRRRKKRRRICGSKRAAASQFYNNTPKVTFSFECVGVYGFGTSTYCIL